MSDSRRLPNLLVAVVLLMAILGVALFGIAVTAKLLNRAVQRAAEKARQEQVHNNLRTISEALDQYHDAVPVAVEVEVEAGKVPNPEAPMTNEARTTNP